MVSATDSLSQTVTFCANAPAGPSMTIDEFRKKLDERSEQEVSRFRADFGGGEQTCEQLVRSYVDHPEYERRICHLLHLQTQEERMTEAAINAAKSGWGGAEIFVDGFESGDTSAWSDTVP